MQKQQEVSFEFMPINLKFSHPTIKENQTNNVYFVSTH